MNPNKWSRKRRRGILQPGENECIMAEQIRNQPLKLKLPPIVEAVVDIDCDLPPDRPLSKIEEEATASLRESYPKVEKKFIKQVQFGIGEQSTHKFKEGIAAFLFRREDGRQLTQFRNGGYSFNRLAPYDGLDTYLPEIKHTWENYKTIALPKTVRKISLRTINRIPLPLDQKGSLKLGEYLQTDPRLPQIDGRTLSFTGFVHRHQIRDEKSGQEAHLVLASQDHQEGKMNLLLDISAFDRSMISLDPQDWDVIESTIQSLRRLKNDLFANILTQKCLDQF